MVYRKIQATIYPNPTTDNLTLRYSEKLSTSSFFHIYNLTGNKVFTKEIIASSSNSQISPISLPDGIYFYSINLADGSEISAGKLIILK
ncbi:MAG: T9SS type A sorting domain-containing protein [Saprospiraceae bacterium]